MTAMVNAAIGAFKDFTQVSFQNPGKEEDRSITIKRFEESNHKALTPDGFPSVLEFGFRVITTLISGFDIKDREVKIYRLLIGGMVELGRLVNH